MKKQRTIQQDPRTGKYYVKIQVEGVRRTFYLGTDKKSAGRRLTRIEREIAAGKIAFVGQATSATMSGGQRDIQVSELVVRHLEWVKANRAAGTFKLRRHYGFRFMEFLGLGCLKGDRFEVTGSMMVSELTRSDMTRFHLWAKNQTAEHPNAGNQYLRQVKTILLWGVDEELCDLSFRKFPPMTETPPATKRVDFDDLAKLLDEADDDLTDLIRFGLLTGLRPQELRELTTDQVINTTDGRCYIRIERHKTAGRTRESGVRTVPLGDEAMKILHRQTDAHPHVRHVFLNQGGTPYTRTVLRNRMIRCCQRAGIPNITPYALRHTFASMESDARVETTALARLMGHSTVRTLARYVSNSSDHDLRAVQAAEATLDEALRKTE